ncbi:MAG: acyl-CoA synthetase FdrA [Anaerolineae bacterium]
MIVQTLVKPGEYRDSVALMLLARELGNLPGVGNVSVVMGTPANRALLVQAGLLTPAAEHATPNDLVIAVQARDAATAAAACRQAEQLLAAQATGAVSSTSGALRPRSLRTAVRALPQANVAVISVPGPYAAAPAWDALRAGLHVLLFSDHVSIEDEIALKEYARDHGLFLMGPGAGTAIMNGIGLGFANAVPRGPVGIVAAAGTGLQEVSALLAQAGSGITQGIGTGGRDVSEQVGGIMMLEGLKALQADSDTRVILVVSKLPSPAVADKILAQVRQSDKPTVLALMRAQERIQNSEFRILNSNLELSNLLTAFDLREAAALAAALARGEDVKNVYKQLAAEDRKLHLKANSLRRPLNARQRYIRGLYSGGTLCEEAMRIWQAELGEVWSNAPLDLRYKLPDSAKSKRHTAIDLGEEEFTLGRPHPMIDNTLRIQHLFREARDPSVGVIVLDVVLGYGAHPDPAAELGPAIAQAREYAGQQGRFLNVVLSITGTEDDPQNRTRQAKAFKQAGAVIAPSNAAAARLASWIVK